MKDFSTWTVLVLFLGLAIVCGIVLADVAQHSRTEPNTHARTIADYKAALELGGKFIGFAAALTGFFGIATGASKALKGQGVGGVGAGLGGLLGGATLLGIGGWAAPVALGALALGGSAVEITRLKRDNGPRSGGDD